MRIPKIPATASQEYLEDLEEKIKQQLSKTSNVKVKAQLQALLKLLKEMQQLRQGQPQQKISSRVLVEALAQINKNAPLSVPDTTNLTEEAQEAVKNRLKDVLEEIQSQQPELRESSSEPSEPSIPGENDESSRSSVLDTVHLTAQEHQIVKERMREMLKVVQNQQQEPAAQESHPQIQPGTDDISFSAVCRRIGKGESLKLFANIDLSKREQEMLQAFEDHLSQVKSLKKQQVFDMQHLTSRSINELDQIFKTYHLQGYLRAELNNIYNRLLNLRGRLSTLLN